MSEDNKIQKDDIEKDDVTTTNETEKKTKKKIPVLRLILLGLILYVTVRFVIGDGREYNYVEDTAVYGTQEANTIYPQNIFKGEDGSRNVVYNSNRHDTAYSGNLESKEYIERSGIDLYDVNVVGNTAYALEGAYGDGFRIVSFDLNSPEEITIIWEKANSTGKQVMTLQNLLVVDNCCYFICNGDDEMDKSDDSFMCLNLATGEENVIESPTFTEYFIDNDMVYFINRDDNQKLYRMPIQGGEATKLSSFTTLNAFMYNGRIYYQGILNVFCDFLMSMNPDGTDHKIHRFWDCDYSDTAFSNGKLYDFEDMVITSIDLTDGKFTKKEINVENQVISIITTYYADDIDPSVSQDEVNAGVNYQFGPSFTVSEGYAYFVAECTIGQTRIMEAFLCDLETGDVYLLNEYFGIGPEVEYKPVIK